MVTHNKIQLLSTSSYVFCVTNSQSLNKNYRRFFIFFFLFYQKNASHENSFVSFHLVHQMNEPKQRDRACLKAWRQKKKCWKRKTEKIKSKRFRTLTDAHLLNSSSFACHQFENPICKKKEPANETNETESEICMKWEREEWCAVGKLRWASQFNGKHTHTHILTMLNVLQTNDVKLYFIVNVRYNEKSNLNLWKFITFIIYLLDSSIVYTFSLSLDIRICVKWHKMRNGVESVQFSFIRCLTKNVIVVDVKKKIQTKKKKKNLQLQSLKYWE